MPLQGNCVVQSAYNKAIISGQILLFRFFQSRFAGKNQPKKISRILRRYVARGIMPKRKHWTPGNYIEIPISGNRFCYGVVTITERLAIMDYCNTEKLSPEQVADLPILFELVVMNYAIGKNGWPLAGQVEYLDKFKNFPLNFKQDKITGKYYILDHTWANSTLATEGRVRRLRASFSLGPLSHY